jgi:uncharacterized Zn finger protein
MNTDTKNRFEDEKNENIRLAKMLLEQLKGINENGLDKVYTDFKDYLYDMYPDLPWNEEGQTEAINYLLNNDEFKVVAEGIKTKFDFDLIADFKECIKENEEEMT